MVPARLLVGRTKYLGLWNNLKTRIRSCLNWHLLVTLSHQKAKRVTKKETELASIALNDFAFIRGETRN